MSLRPFTLLRALVLLLLLAATSAAAALEPFNRQVRVLLDVTSSLTVGATGPHSGSVDGVPRFSTAAALDWPVTAADGQLYVDGVRVGAQLLLEADGSFLRVNGNRYRGSVRLVAEGDLIQVVNVLDMESYLRGVVPSEMSASWPMEALKAQAVAARSYTLTSLDPSASYDLCATVDCQVYRGVEVEHARTDTAIAATAGVVVTYGGATARTYYHADSGGMIASSQEVWGAALPYLVARADAPTSTPHRAWVYRLDAAVVSASMEAAGLAVGTVQSVRVVRLSESGRVVELEVAGTAGARVVRGSQLTSMARSWGLKSTRFSVQGGLTVRGDGWGHGVGMSQYGARALAQAGYDFGRILAYFYPTTALTQFVADGR
ncbi:MAG: SpoIID/LytB domain-containing protein [Trueperaceae bacterium]|jgi:stage II sporulation protein D